jgi:ATP/maltotriose-dependent transcriptional regulator MalT
MALAKTTRPTLATTVRRTRLFRRLERARRVPVTWVWGPPGSGKTTLVASYLAATRRRALWYQLDQGDGDVATFFYYLGLAAPRRRTPLPVLTQEYRQGLGVFTRRFFRELFARLHAPFAVVFDNYQETPADSSLHEVMRDAVEEIPRGGQLIFVSRSEPPPAFARLLTHKLVDVVDWPELRFTEAEAAALVRQLAPKRRSREGVRSLYEAADGWCAGLILLLDEHHREGESTIGGGRTPAVLFDYFAGEIFKRAEADVQHALMRTAFMPHVTTAMAERLTGQARVGEILASLHRQNYFTNKQPGTPPTYSYHPLFRQFLLEQARRVYAAPERAAMQRESAALLDEAGRIEAAAELLRDAEDWHSLAQLIYRHAQTLIAQGRTQTLQDWLAAIPPALFDEQPWLSFWRGLGWMAWRHSESQRALEQAFVAFRRRGDTMGTFLSWAAVIFALISEGQLAPMDRWISVLDDILAETPAFPTKGVETRVAIAMLIATTFRRPGHPGAASWAARVIDLGPRHPDPTTRAMAIVNWIHYQIQFGDVASASAVVDEMRRVARARDVSPVAIVNASMPVAWYEAITAVPSYRDTVARVLELSRTTGVYYTARHVVLSSGLLAALSDGDVETAGAWLHELEKDVHLLGPMFRCWHQWFLVWQSLLLGDVSRAATLQPELLRLAELEGCPLDIATAHVMSAQVVHARGDKDPRPHVERALEIAAAIRSPYIEFMTRLTEAHLSLDAGREGDARAALRTALRLGREHRYVNTHAWIPAVMARLCVTALAAGIETDYVRELIIKRGLVPEQPPVALEAWPWPIRIFALGRLEVVRDGAPVRFARKVQRRPLELLKLLVAFGGRLVREDVAMDTLWPEADGDAARMALTTTVHRLRTLLGRADAVIRQDGQLSLNSRVCWVDAWAVEHLLNTRAGGDDAEDRLRNAARLYRGHFLESEEGGLPHIASRADDLRRRLARALASMARQTEAADPDKAAQWYEEAGRVHPGAEDDRRRAISPRP